MKKFRILIVDDHPHFINALKFMLNDSFEKNIQSIDVANNGSECIDLLSEKIIDLIFMDIDMPVMNGIETTHIINNNYRDMVVIALSFHADMKYIIQMIEAGARSYIIKEEINKDTLAGIFEKF
jgi:DNA-binding NarL/FixJ family response regulator